MTARWDANTTLAHPRGKVRIAVLSDIHGNSLALSAVLEALLRLEVDFIVNLGDSLSGAVDPHGTAELLRSQPALVTIRGNHDRRLLTLKRDQIGGVDLIAERVITDDDRQWLEQTRSPPEYPLPRVTAFHGSPSDDECYLLETVEPNGLREASDDEIIERLGSAYGAYDLHLCGHSHLQRERRLPDRSLIVNPGSVGWPAFRDDVPYPHVVEAGTSDARFTIVEWSRDGWTAQPHAVAYDHDRAAALAENYDRPDIAHAIRTGRMQQTPSEAAEG